MTTIGVVAAVVAAGAVGFAATAAAGGSTSLRAMPQALDYGSPTTLSGEVASGRANERVAILGEDCGETSFTEVASAATAAGGAFATTLRPRATTAYEARAGNSTSAPAVVRVRPQLVLLRRAPQTFAATLLAADSFAGKILLFERYAPTRHRFVVAQRVVLAAGVTQTAPLVPTVTSTARFRVRIRARLRVRLVLPAAQAAPCYALARSAVTRS